MLEKSTDDPREEFITKDPKKSLLLKTKRGPLKDTYY